jgi:hypothetical protein
MMKVQEAAVRSRHHKQTAPYELGHYWNYLVVPSASVPPSTRQRAAANPDGENDETRSAETDESIAERYGT